jgi:hypothetical protein
MKNRLNKWLFGWFLLASSVVLPAVAPTSAASGDTVDRTRQTFTFAIVGDRTGGAVEGVFEQVLDEVSFLNPDLIVTVGDHIQGYLPDSAGIEGQWDYAVQLMERTGIEYHLTPGNHDIWDDQSRRIYISRFGSPDTFFEYLDNLFVIIDVSTAYSVAGLSAGKVEWLEQILSRSDHYANVFVFYHKPFWCEDMSMGRSSRLHDLFKQYGVKAVFTGHYHRHFYAEADSVRYFGVSSSGGSLPPGGRVKGSFYAYLLAKVTGDSLDVRLMEPGLGQPVDVLTVDDVIRIAGIEKKSVRLSETVVEGAAFPEERKVTVTIENPASVTLRDTAVWDLREGWSVEPIRDYVEVPPGEIGTLTAYAHHEGPLFPVPLFKVRVPLDNEGLVEVTEPLRVKRLVSAVRNSNKMQVDGLLDESVWQRASSETGFYRAYRGDTELDSTVLTICYDDSKLYFGIECLDGHMDSLAATVIQRDGFRRYDDNLSVLLEPDPGSEVFYLISVNPLGTLFDYMVEICPFGTYVIHPEWNPSIEVATQMLDDRWTVELAVPLDALGSSVEKEVRWGFNFDRWQTRLRNASRFQTPFWYDTDHMALLVFR